MATDLFMQAATHGATVSWALVGAFAGWWLERLVLWLPTWVLAPYGAQIRTEDWHGPGGGLLLKPSRLRQLTLAGLNAWAWGACALGSPAPGVWVLCTTALLVLAVVDWNTSLLPDVLVLSLLWTGLLASERGWTLVDVSSSLWSAVLWYLAMRGLAWIFERLTGRTGMGHGDAKLLAAMAAWWGWAPVIWALLLGSLLVLAMGLIWRKHGLRAWSHVPFGPFLVAGITLWSVHHVV